MSEQLRAVVVNRSTTKPLALKTSEFPAGEEYIKIMEPSQVEGAGVAEVKVTLLSADSKTIMQAILLADAVKRLNKRPRLVLVATYLPYGRQDRVCEKGESFSLEVVGKMIESAYDYIETVDVHSAVSKNVFSSSLSKYDEDVYNKYYMKLEKNSTVQKTKLDICENVDIVVPDNGAVDRAGRLAQHTGYISETIKLNKRRIDGKIILSTDDRFIERIKNGKNFVISDDICDGGGTFIVAANFIKTYNPNAEITLILSHGIFSQGLDFLFDFYKTIYVLSNDYNNRRVANAMNMDKSD